MSFVYQVTSSNCRTSQKPTPGFLAPIFTDIETRKLASYTPFDWSKNEERETTLFIDLLLDPPFNPHKPHTTDCHSYVSFQGNVPTAEHHKKLQLASKTSIQQTNRRAHRATTRTTTTKIWNFDHPYLFLSYLLAIQ